MAGIKRSNSIDIDEKINEYKEMKDALNKILESFVDEMTLKIIECDQQIAYLNYLKKKES